MAYSGSSIKTVAWREGRVRLIDQTSLPSHLRYIEYDDWRAVAEAIRVMVVRGAPAIGCTAALGLALAARDLARSGDHSTFLARLCDAADVFRGTRPTAVNLFWAVDRMVAVARAHGGTPDDVAQALLVAARNMLAEDIETNRLMGAYGAALLPDDSTVLTHCNAGALATVGFGTALGVIRAAVEAGKRVRVYADETRPRLQGMKLTAWELHQDHIPVTIITDNMAAVLLRDGRIDCVVVGADRIAANGDTANKIGTYGVAVLAQYHRVPFYVAAPFSTVDSSRPDGSHIPIEERDSGEVTHIDGHRVAPEGIPVWNPAFDVTPGTLVTGIITERGVLRPPYGESLSARG